MTNNDFSGARWRTSSYSANQGQCVEVAPAAEAVGVRDSKNRAIGNLAVSRAAWRAFARAASNERLVR